MTLPRAGRLSNSFRDPAGFLYQKDGVLYRQVNQEYRPHYEKLISSGLYEKLAANGWLVRSHEENVMHAAEPASAFKVLRPERLPFISYAYEWCFSQLKAAALLTLEIQKLSLAHGLSLKDASVFNIQFMGKKPVFIDTLSFECYDEGKPWDAYRQFCRHFLAPLALIACRDFRLAQLLRIHIDGIPLDLTAALLPLRTKFNFGLFTHLHAHAMAERHYANQGAPRRQGRMKRFELLALLDSLETTVRKLRWRLPKTEWGDYYDRTNYSESSLRLKEQIVQGLLNRVMPDKVWDLGANTCRFSRLAAQRGIFTVAFDIDPAAIEKAYLDPQLDPLPLIPLYLDLTNPSGAVGWAHRERSSFMERGPVDAVMALALIHHLAISNNLPFEHIALFFAQICRHLIIEFVPKTDSQVQRLLATRTDIFREYDEASFRKVFSRYFTLASENRIPGTERTIFLFSNPSGCADA